ncbi:MAG TPA: MgtC/SapB family protein [Fimbriimonadaceae bacterium]|nr:MgtC/SapB family protein [Fimbriimonadaceae bacterium]HRJ96284.1 MgtC/SapB family protein [Fimbriimonadaceae bacterium]
METLREVFSSESLTTASLVLLKMGLGVVLGGMVGWERELHGRPAGVRTHMLIVLGVVIICEVSRIFDPVTPSRIAASIVTGIGFLGAGTILRTGPEVRGLTTAASIWAVSGIGMAVSTGGPFFIVAILGTLLTLATLTYVEKLERRFAPDTHPRELHVGIDRKDRLTALLQALENAGMKVGAVRVLGEEGGVLLSLEVRGASSRGLDAALGSPGVSSARWHE